MENNYLGYPAKKVYEVLLKQLPKSGYKIARTDADPMKIFANRKKFLAKGATVEIAIIPRKSDITEIHVSASDARYEDTLMMEVILRIF